MRAVWKAGALRVTAAVTLCLAGMVTAAFTVWTVYRLHVPLLYRDEWYTVDHFRRFAEGNYGLAGLAEQHNEHRLLFPRLFFFVDELFFKLSGTFDLTVTLALQAANAALLIRWMASIVPGRLHRALLSGFVVTLLFTLLQEQNFTNGFQLQFVGVFTAAALAGSAYSAALEHRNRRSSAAYFALAAFGYVVAAYTMANGLLLGGTLAVTAVLRRASWPIPAATIALSTLVAAGFLRGYVPGEFSLPLSQGLMHPLPYLSYLATYLGNPIDASVRIDRAFGILGLALTLGAAWRIWTGRTGDRASVNLFMLAVFVVASAAATAYGRITLGTLQATESRYTTPSLLFWCAIILFWFPVLIAASQRRIATFALGGGMAVLAGVALKAEATAWPALAERSAALHNTSDSLLSGLYDTRAADVYENTPPDEVGPFVPFLRDHRLAAFADPDADALGRPLSALDGGATPRKKDCTGTVEARTDVSLGTRGVRLDGTALDLLDHRAPHRIFVTDAAGMVVGFGSASLPSRPSRLWWGYATAAAGDVLRVRARRADGTLCDLGSAVVDGREAREQPSG